MRDALLEVAESLRVHDERAFSLFGERHEARASHGAIAADSVLTPEATTLLGQTLYSALHCRLPGDAPPNPARSGDRKGALDFAQRLSDANCGTGTWQSGWTVRSIAADGQVVAEIFDLSFWVSPSDVRAASGPVEAGCPVQVRVPKEYRQLHSGFYTALGDADEDLESSPSVRVYWNVHPGGAVALTAQLTAALNESRVPFLLKVADDPGSFARCDSAVLYLPRARYRATVPLLAATHRRLREFMRAPLSAFVKRLAHGLGAADDPGDGSSFGEHRCRLVAATLARPEAALATSVGERLDAVRTALRRDGYDPAALFLNPGSADDFEPFDDRAPNAH
ncbi:MAG TPA: T3SS effector HopA1 family protein [Gemmatimonadaceae bacterium]|nr:T3SS effector HopA1 family protein [Gemmatimonadaceae bacterium]